jgi:drug/metabolite transporter (DMT)-like permease
MTAGVAGLVLLAAVMHASWNAALRGGRDVFWGGAAMSFFSGTACLLVVSFLPFPKSASWLCIFLSGLIHIAYSLLLVRMYREGDFGVTYPVARGSSPLLIALGGAVLSSELVAPVRFVGIVLVSAGIFTIAVSRDQLHREGIPPAIATGVAIAAYSLTDGLGARRSGNTVSYTAWMMMLQGAGMALVFRVMRRRDGPGLFSGRPARELWKAGGAGLVSVLGYGIVIWAMTKSPMGLVSALRETSVLFAAILGRIFLREPFTARKVLAAILIGAGIICLH